MRERDVGELADAIGEIRQVTMLVKIAVLLGVGLGDPEHPQVMDAVKDVQCIAERIENRLRYLDQRWDEHELAALRAEGRATRLLARGARDLSVEAFREGFERVHGCYVYLLWGHDQNVPLYVGQSENVLARLGQHMSTRARRSAVERVALIHCKDRAAMLRTESALIRSYAPPWNVLGISEQ